MTEPDMTEGLFNIGEAAARSGVIGQDDPAL